MRKAEVEQLDEFHFLMAFDPSTVTRAGFSFDFGILTSGS